jgi:hypothetical protein
MNEKQLIAELEKLTLKAKQAMEAELISLGYVNKIELRAMEVTP